MQHFFQGFLLTLLAIAGILGGLYFFQERGVKLMEAPVVAELTDTYQEGLRTIMAVAGHHLEVDRSSAASVIPLPESALSSSRTDEAPSFVDISWSRDIVLEKLRKKGFSRGAIKGAERYLLYIEAYRDEALRDMHRSGVSASITLAQGIIESNAGASRLAKKTNNHFGIKARQLPSARAKINQKRYQSITDADFTVVSPAVGVSQHWDDNSYDRFETYRSVQDSYRRHSALLTSTCSKPRKGCYAWIWKAFPITDKPIDITAWAKRFEPVSGIAAETFFEGRTSLPYYAAQAAGLKMAGYATSATYHRKLAYLIDTYELWRFDADLIRAMGANYFQ